MDITRFQCESVLLQALLLETYANFDIVRLLVKIPDNYSMSRVSTVTSQMRATGLISKIGFSTSSRRIAKSGGIRIWKLTSKVIAECRLRDLADELGTDFPEVTREDLEKVKPREVHWQPPKKRKPDPNQMTFFQTQAIKEED